MDSLEIHANSTPACCLKELGLALQDHMVPQFLLSPENTNVVRVYGSPNRIISGMDLRLCLCSAMRHGLQEGYLRLILEILHEEFPRFRARGILKPKP